jgi:hypothetical protein
MNGKAIYKLSNELKEKQIQTLLNDWISTNEIGKLKQFQSLVKLGDSRALAMATVMLSQKKEFNNEMHQIAYYS